MENSVELDKKRKVPAIEVDERQLRAHVSEVVRQSVEETLTYCDFPSAHGGESAYNNPATTESRNPQRNAGSRQFPGRPAALMLASARLRSMAGQKWGAQCYLNMRTEE